MALSDRNLFGAISLLGMSQNLSLVLLPRFKTMMLAALHLSAPLKE